MNRISYDVFSYILRAVFICLAVFGSTRAEAFSLTTYADSSVLATGKWVKISVPASGMYRIPAATLRRWGFNDPTSVRIHGYGGARIADALTQSTYIDDIPVAPFETLDDGSIVFYGVGPLTWTSSVSGRYIATPNFYTNDGYYFIGESGASLPEFNATGNPGAEKPTTTFFERLHHEQDIATPGEAGGHLVGEDFRLTPQRTFTFNLPGRTDNGIVWMETSFVARTLGSPSSLIVSANGEQLPPINGDVIPATVTDAHYHGSEAVGRRDIPVTGEKLDITLRHAATSTIYGAWLNYISINYERKLDLALAGNVLVFTTPSAATALAGADETTRLWDVTNVTRPRAVASEIAGGSATWTNTQSGIRTYAAWKPTASMPEPTFVGTVRNQNLHRLTDTEMVIVCPAPWTSQAERIAAIHRAEGLSVAIVDPDEIYNEFASGSPDVAALRKFFKMLYDRGNDSGVPLRYALLIGRATYDNRHNTPAMADSPVTIPSWLGGTMRNSLNDEDGFGTDDVTAMLADNSGSNRGFDRISIALGRIPARSVSELSNYIDKLEQYVLKPRMTGWKNQIMIVADDEDQGIHLTQAERMEHWLKTSTPENKYQFNKVYLDAFQKSGGNYPLARERMFRHLDNGMAWWMFVGHANNHSMTHDGQLTYNDINSMFLKHYPVLYAATCDFLRWDSNTISGGEIMFHERYGGVIAAISAVRPVFIYENGLLNEAMGRFIGARDENGHHYRLGDIYRLAKNDIRNAVGDLVSNTNRLRFVLMGDPAMRMPIPDNIVRLDTIDGAPLSDDDSQYPVIAARQKAVFTGSVTDPSGNVLTGFNGTVTATILDAETDVTTNGNGNGKVDTYTEQGSRVFAGSAPVVNGKFSLTAVIPAEIANNTRPAAINLYALANDATVDADSTATGSAALNGHLEAIGVDRRFFLAGYDDTTPADTVAPTIDSFYLNHPDFYDGARVNDSPMAIARISDDISINLSSAGIGHSMLLTLDGTKTYNDVSEFYTPSADGTPSGTINYPLDGLTPGEHTLTLRVWDADTNKGTASISFVVDKSVAPRIFDIYSDANPASTQANFYITHDRPDQMVTVTVSVYNLLGAPVWSRTTTGISDMFLSSPVTWDLTDTAGRRVQRGIYLYRATITCDGETFDSGSRRIAVTN